MRAGAYDFILKPLDPSHLEVVINKALERDTLRQENRLLQQGLLQRAPADFRALLNQQRGRQSGGQNRADGAEFKCFHSFDDSGGTMRCSSQASKSPYGRLTFHLTPSIAS